MSVDVELQRFLSRYIGPVLVGMAVNQPAPGIADSERKRARNGLNLAVNRRWNGTYGSREGSCSRREISHGTTI